MWVREKTYILLKNWVLFIKSLTKASKLFQIWKASTKSRSSNEEHFLIIKFFREIEHMLLDEQWLAMAKCLIFSFNIFWMGYV